MTERRINLAGDVESDGRAVTGSWSETTRNASGTVSGRVSGDRVQVLERGDSFSANLSLVTRVNRQSVAIQPQGTEISEVSITLAKGQPGRIAIASGGNILSFALPDR